MAKKIKINKQRYEARHFGDEKLFQKFRLQRDDAKRYFLDFLKPRYDRSYKLYTSYNGDRAKEIQSWQANVFVPYTFSVVETMKPRILDARPDFNVAGRNEIDQEKAIKLQQTNDYTWEISGMDDISEDFVSASMIYGMSWLQTWWKKDVRAGKYFVGKDVNTKKKKYADKEITHYDAPAVECVDNYGFWYDWRNIPHASKQFFFKRLVKNGSEIRRRYPDADPSRLELAFLNVGAADLTDYGSIRIDVKGTHEQIVRGADATGVRAWGSSVTGNVTDLLDRYQSSNDPDLQFHEVFERHCPFDDTFDVWVNDVPVLDGGQIPNPYNFKEAPFIDLPFVRIPFEYEGMGYPLLLEQPQVMLNLIKNQRLDAATMSIHKMWIVNPLANIKKEQLVTRPFGIVWSSDPNGVREVQFSDIKESSYREEEMLKSDMRYASGVDDFSMGVAGDVGSATAVRHLRESTLERVRLFINHLGSSYSKLMRYWIVMYDQFLSGPMKIRITDADGTEKFGLIEKGDLRGEFDFKATVLPSIAGKSDIDKKTGMDLFQLLINLPFTDPKKLTSKILHPWGWSVGSIAKDEEQMAQQGAAPMVPGAEQGALPPEMSGQVSPEMAGQMPQGSALEDILSGAGPQPQSAIPQAAIENAVRLLGGGIGPSAASPFTQVSSPINLTEQPQQAPPTVLGIGGGPGPSKGLSKTTNLRGHNRSGKKVNTNLPTSRGASDPGAALLNQSQNLQR